MANTPNYNFKLIDFDTIPWHEDEHDNWRIIDSVFANFIVVSNLQGVWQNALTVTVGQKFVDAELGTMWECLVAHTTPSTGTFAASRTATSTNWSAFTVQVSSKGTWTTATTYSPNDFVVDSNRYGIVQAAYTSDTTYDIDVAAGNIVTLIDTSSDIAATAASATAAAASASSASSSATSASNAQTAAETAETNAETAKTNAETAQSAAETAETNAETAETNAETAETNAAASASAASTSESNASTSETNANTSATNAGTSATNAAASATAAAASASIFGTKGGDLTSANPLVINTDGDYFDVTGTTNFASMTVAADRFFKLQFDGILTMTHHATNLDLPGEANVTTAAGDVAVFQSTGSNTVQCISYTKADGTAVVAGAGGGPGKGTAPSTFYRSNAKVQNENITVSDHSTNFTATNATNVLNVGTDDDFANDTNVRLTTSGADLPNGWAIDTDYYVIGATSNTMQIAATVGGAAVTISDDGSGTHTVFEVINATAVGPITIKTGNSLTIPSGSRVVIL